MKGYVICETENDRIGNVVLITEDWEKITAEYFKLLGSGKEAVVLEVLPIKPILLNVAREIELELGDEKDYNYDD